VTRQTALASFERLRLSPKPRILFVSHAYGGGVRRHVEELAAAIAHDAEVLLLTPNGNRIELRVLGSHEPAAIWFDPRMHWPRLVELLRSLAIDRVHFHHIHGLPREALDLPRDLGASYDITLHDHFAICPQYHLLDGQGRFCGGDPGCHHCLELQPAQWPMSIDEWRAALRKFLHGGARLIAPSQDIAQRIQRHFPECSPVVWPHPREEHRTPPRALRVLVPGAISPAKGLSLLVACAKDAAARRLPLHFHVVGYIAYPVAVWPEVPLTIGGEYPEGALPELLAASGGDALFFPAQVPESYSFTLTDALDTGLPIVATNLGALPERLAAYSQAHIVRWDAPAAEINDALLALRRDDRPRAQVSAPHTTLEQYRVRYLQELRRGAEKPATSRLALDPAWLAPPPEQGPPPPHALEWLFGDAFWCGRALSRDKLHAGVQALANPPDTPG
jgi:glycosyltransferase involved in cell wall biosynthesis